MNGRFDIACDQIDTVRNGSDIYCVSQLPLSELSSADHVLLYLCNGMYQVPETHACDRLGVVTGVEALYLEVMQNVLVKL